MKARLLSIILMLTLPAIILAQTDTLFWFAVPYATPLHTTLTADITLTATDESNITTIVISQPYNPAIGPITVTIDPAVSLTQTVTFTQAQLLLFSNNVYNTKTNSALLIRSDREITAYFELNRSNNNPAIFALKGRNALGYDFWIPFQNQWANHVFSNTNPAFSQIIVVATKDNTQVTFNFKKPANGYAANTNYTITLNRGQTYMFVPPLIGGVPSVLAADRLAGTHITANNPISITLNDDSVQKSGAYDDMGDQHIPVKNVQNKPVIGLEYIVMKGQMPAEKVYVMTTEPNSMITVTRRDGSTVTYGPYAAGYQLAIDMLAADYYIQILGTKPIYVLHIAGFGDEMGNAILPTIDGCTGSLSVSFTRSKPQAFYLNLMTKADAIDSFYMSVNNGPATSFLSGADFEQAGTSDWYVLKDANKLRSNLEIPAGRVTRIYNTKNVFHLGYFNGVNTGGGCVYGYFSDYNELEASATVEDQGSVFQVCGVDSIQLRAKGGISYHWTPTEYLSDPNIQNPVLRLPYGDFEQTFRVDIEQPCFGFTPMYVFVIVPKSPNSFIAVSNNNGCAPLTIDMKDASQSAVKYILDVGDGSPIQASTTPINVTHDYHNTTDTIVNYIISYTVSSEDGCNDFYTDTVQVFPQVLSDFELVNPKDTAVCHLSTIDFRNTSTGNTDTYQWNFGDGSSDTDTLVSHTYSNYGSNDTTFHVSLLSVSPFGCIDTSEKTDIRVFPYIYSTFTVDSALRCSPAEFFINPLNSVGVDSFYWSISDINKTFLDSSFINLNKNPINLLHNNNERQVPDTLQIAMHAVNRFGCADTATTRSVIVYPEVNSDFSISDNAVCDSVGVLITNNSTGFNLMYEWDLGNGTSINDTSQAQITRYFYNRTDHDTIYTIRLVSTSDYFCKDTATVQLTVYPFIKANFAVDYSNNCSPLNVEVVNVSRGGDEFNWDLGDGNLITTFSADTLYHIYENNTDNDTTFFIHLLASNTQGCEDSAMRSVALFPRVIANFNFDSPNQGCNPLNVSFINNSKGKDLNYIWDFGDKTYSTSQNPPPRTYKNSTDKDTTYYVNLTVMNLAGCDSSVTKTVDVYSKVTADFSIERVDSCSPFKIKVDNFSSGGITDFIWKYTENDSITLHDFSDPVIPVYHNNDTLPVKYPIILNTRNIHNCSAVKYDTITVFPEMHVDFQADRISGCQPLSVGFSNHSNIIAGTSFFWNFDDGRYSNIASPPEHVYNNLTNDIVQHNIHLEATTQFGCYDSATVPVNIYPYIYAKFNIDKPAICANELFTIDRSSSAGAIENYKWYWDYQNAPLTFENKPDDNFTHTYPNTGINSLNPKIKLTVTNAQGCDTSWTESIAVHPQVRAAFTADNEQICYPLPSVFTNQSQPAVPLTYYWNFGDGSSSVNKDPVHAYKNFSRTEDKSITVDLTATSEFGCDSTVSKTITIHPKPMAEFNFPLAVDCPPFTVQFTNSSLGTNLNYNWDFGNGNTSSEMNPASVYNNTGSDIAQHDVSLIVVTDYSCRDTVVKPVQVYPGVEVNFEASDWNGCSPMQINLDGTATNENEYYWYVDERVISNYQDPTYRFVNETPVDKVFNIKFRALSINGCVDETVKQITVFPKPLAEFLPSPQAQDFNTDTDITRVTLNNQTNNQAAWKYQWNFGDGTTSTQSSASFDKNYTIWGDIHNDSRIPVNLIAASTSHPQCSDTIMHYIIIRPPLPRVEIGSDVLGCKPLTVDFSATTKYIYPDSYQWDFGYNGQISTDANPLPVVYDMDNTYIVRLTVKGDGGTSWDYKTITVHPKPVVNFDFTPKFAYLKSQTEDGEPVKFFNHTDEAVNYIWDFGDETAESSEYQPQHEYLKAGTFYITLKAENGYGCWDTLTGDIPVVIEGHGKLTFPNAITITPGNPSNEYYDPNDADSYRSVFRPDNQGVEKYKLEIYNRWGEMVFASNDVNKGWNGFIKGAPAKQDVYVWRVTATFTNGQPYHAAGDVTVLVMQP